MRTLVSELIPWIASNAGDSGMCADTDQGKAFIISQLDLACESLSYRIDDSGTLWYWDCPAGDGCFALPEDVQDARSIWVNGLTATQHDQWYQARVAYGQRDCGSQVYLPQIDDQGEFPIPYPLMQVQGVRLGYVAQSDADAGKNVTVEYTNEYGETKREDLTLLSQQHPVFTDGVCRDCSFFAKPVTEDNVKCYQKVPTGQRFFLCDYGPKIRVGSFRRKRLPQRFCGCTMVRIKGKRRYVRLTSESDICPFDNRGALQFALSAIAARTRNDAGDYDNLMAHALNELWRQMQDNDGPQNVSQMHFRSGNAGNWSQAGNRPMPGTAPYMCNGWGGQWGWGR